jgi:hypothetical protein
MSGTRNSRITGIPDTLRLALGEAADDNDGLFPPDLARQTIGALRRRGWARKSYPTYDWQITPDGREALARAELALKTSVQQTAPLDGAT